MPNTRFELACAQNNFSRNSGTECSLRYALVNGYSVGFQDEFRFFVECKFATCKSQARASKIVAKNRLTEETKHRRGQLFIVAWLHEKPAFLVPDELRDLLVDAAAASHLFKEVRSAFALTSRA